MAKLKELRNKNSSALPMYVNFSTEDRVLVLANLIVDQIQADQCNNGPLLKKILRQEHV